MDDRLDIPLPPGASALIGELVSAGYDALLVGGAVRDALLGRDVCDLDLVTDAPPEVVREAASQAVGVRGVYAVGERFGTLGVTLDTGEVIEVSAYRPDAAEATTTAERFAIDAGHRDFTVDALAVVLPSGSLLDPLSGREDLAARVLRAPGFPAERFAEDPLRVLRGARLAAQLGFSLEPDTAAAMWAASGGLANIAAERVRVELTKLLVAPHAPHGLAVLTESGALAVVLPEVAALDGLTQPTFHDLDVLAHTFQAVSLAPPTAVMRWAALLHDVGKGTTRTIGPDGRIRFLGHAPEGARIAAEICARLRFSHDDAEAVVHLVAEHMRLGEINAENPRSVDRAVRRLDLRRGPRYLVSAEDALELTMADFSATAHRDEAPEVRRRLAEALAASRERGSHVPITSPVTGDELMRRLGLEEGVAVGVAKQAVLDAIEQGTLDADDSEGAIEVARRATER